MSLSRKIPLLILSGLGLLLLLWLAVLGQTIAELGRVGMADRLAAQLRELGRAVDETHEVALARAELLASWPELARYTRDGKKELLIPLVAPVFQLQNRRHGMDQLNIFSVRGVAVLRAQSPGLSGDSVLQERPLVAAVLRAQVAQAAVVIARTGPSIGAVAPMMLDGRPAGLVEVGIDPARLVRQVNADTGAECAVLFDRSVLQSRAPDFARHLATRQDLGRYQGVYGTDWEAILEVLGPEVRGTVQEPRTLVSRQADGLYSAALAPLKDHEGESVGLLVSVQRADVVRGRVLQLAVPMLAGAAILVILGSALVLGVCNGFLVRPVRDLAERLEGLARGDDPPPAGDLVKRQDEVGTLARAYDRLRAGPPGA